MHLIYLLVGVAHQDDFWRDVLGRATDGLHLALFHLLGQPKVGDLDARDVVSIRRPLQQKILQLEIPVGDFATPHPHPPQQCRITIQSFIFH